MASLAPGTHRISMSHGGLDRPYLLHVPESDPRPAGPEAASRAAGLPLVLELHGRGIDAAQFDRMTGFTALAEEMGFIVAAPEAVDEMWNDGRESSAHDNALPDDVGYLAALLADVSNGARVDPARVYVVGMSNGAGMTARFVCERPDLVAAAAQVAGTATERVAATFRPLQPVPLLHVHGTADPIWLYSGGVSETVRRQAMIRHRPEPSVSVDDWARFWVRANGASEPPRERRLTADTTVREWHGPTPRSDLAFYRVEGAGHTWPGAGLPLPSLLFGRTSRTFSAARTAWEFFAPHRAPAAGSGPL